MFEFLGGKTRKRQVQDANKACKEKGQHPNHCTTKNHDRNSAKRQGRASYQIEDDRCIDSSSIDMSLYTTPSKATIQYHRGVHGMYDWQSHDSSVTPKLPSVQSRLGGWEVSPSPPRTVTKEDAEVKHSERPFRSSTQTHSSRRHDAWSSSSYSNASSRGTSSSTSSKRSSIAAAVIQRRLQNSIRETNSAQSSIQSSGPVDVDSLSFVGEEEEVEEQNPADFSDLFSTFEAQSLADRMAPNTALTQHQRTKTKIANKMASRGQDDATKRNWNSSVSRNSRTSPCKKSTNEIHVPGRKESSVPSSFPNSPSDTKSSFRTETNSTGQRIPLDWDDSRSLGTDVSGLTMLTMEQSFVFHSRSSNKDCPRSRPRQNGSSVVLEEPLLYPSMQGDVSFLDLLSRSEDRSKTGMSSPTRETLLVHDQYRSRPESNGSSMSSVKSSDLSDTSKIEGYGRRSVLTPVRDGPECRAISVPVESDSANCSNSESAESRSRSFKASLTSGCSRNHSITQKNVNREEKEDTKSHGETRGEASDSNLSVFTESMSQVLSLERSLDDVSFSGLLSTMEAESLAGRMDATSTLGNLEIPDSQSEAMSSTESLQEHSNGFSDAQSIASESSYRETSILNCISEDDDEVFAKPVTPTLRKDSIDYSSIKPAEKRSDVNPVDCADDHKSTSESHESSLPADKSTAFSSILSVFEARSAASNKLEPPATKQLLPSDDFPIQVEEHCLGDHTKDVTTRHVSESDDMDVDRSSKLEMEDCQDGNASENPTETYSMEPMVPYYSSPSSPLIGDDFSTFSNGLMTIDDQSTILPPPTLSDEYTWNIDSWNPNRQNARNLFPSVDSTEIDAMSRMTFTEEEIDCHTTHENGTNNSDPSNHLCYSIARNSANKIGLATSLSSEVEHSLQYSASMETSLQYSKSTMRSNTFSDVSSLLLSAEKHRVVSKRSHQNGPVDLDESVSDSNSDASSSCGSATIVDPARDTPSKPIVSMQIASPLPQDEEDEHQFFDEDDDVGEYEEHDRSFSSLHNTDYVDEATVEISYKEAMESLSSARFEAGSLLLTEGELKKHIKSTQFMEPHPSSNLKGYDRWKRKQFEKQRYFAQVHEKAMKRKEKLDKILERKRQAHPRTMETSTAGTTQTSLPLESKPGQNNHSAPGIKKGWGILRGSPLKKKDGSGASMPERALAKNKKNQEKREPVAVTLEQFMKVSQDEPDDISLVPMNKLDPGIVTLTSSLPQGGNSAATKSHNLEDAGIGPRFLALQYLEIERAKNRMAEKEKTELEIREQNRIALLKEREVERQRRLNTPSVPNSGESIFKSKVNIDTKSLSTHQMLDRNLSFGTTNTAQSSIKSPASVLSPCILCNAAERSHVAQPCMHFHFCEDCAKSLMCSISPPVCPICKTLNVSFCRVYT
ncbi:zinc finger C3HC4 type domain containing protein [Nitzschia inconspicua]|uniref:Zinc finger C3HC4 type domain containing protein n=1 Tax=Nitzschia inconspicua TaxID=303405 RepID=A0A9K3L148_9STRA|nr:zinc finger C3HC4 type domain containing protein [Nitzschia inconspicua]